LTAERIADVSNRVQNLSYKQAKDSLDFYLARAKIRAGLGLPQSAIDEFENNIRERRFNSETAEHYGLAYAYLRKNDVTNSAQQLAWLKANAAPHPNIENLAATIEVRNRQLAKAQAIYADAIIKYPTHRALVYGYADTYVDSKQPNKAIKLIIEKLRLFPTDAHLYQILAKAYAMTGQELLKHQAQAEAYYRQYDVNRAVEQMEMASKAKDGNFYERSIVEARLKELRRQQGVEKEFKG
jgi:predicted Zn-dependent protease